MGVAGSVWSCNVTCCSISSTGTERSSLSSCCVPPSADVQTKPKSEGQTTAYISLLVLLNVHGHTSTYNTHFLRACTSAGAAGNWAEVALVTTIATMIPLRITYGKRWRDRGEERRGQRKERGQRRGEGTEGGHGGEDREYIGSGKRERGER